MTDTDLTARIEVRFEALETRQRRLEDELAIYRLIATYGPSIDSSNAEATAALWHDDGSYDFGGPMLNGAEAVGQLVNLDTHRAYVKQGCAHVLSLPLVSVKGDTATAVCYSQVFVAVDDGWQAARVSANHLTLTCGPRGWRIVTRETRLLDGTEAARALLARGVNAPEEARQ